MKFSVAIPCRYENPFAALPLIEEVVVEAEGLGLEGLFFPDHYMLPWGNSLFEAWTFLAYIAGKTTRIRLGTCVTPLPLRPPQQLAKMVANLDLLSQGRVTLGVGTGWYREEFEAYSAWGSFGERVARVEEGLELMVGLWTGSQTDFPGRYYPVRGVALEPKPLQKPYPPIWIGATDDRMLRLASKLGRGWVPVGPNWATGWRHTVPAEYRELSGKIEDYSRAHRREGRVERALLMGLPKDVNAARKLVEEYVEAGLEHLIIGLTMIGEARSNLLTYSKEILPSF